MAKFQGFSVQIPSFGAGGYRRSNIGGIFQQMMRRKAQVASDERARQRIRLSDDLIRKRNQAEEQRKAQANRVHAANVMMEESDLRELVLEAYADPKLSPLQKVKMPLHALDPATKGMDPEELEDYILALRPGSRDDEGKPTPEGKAWLKTYQAEQAISYRDMGREARLAARLMYRAKGSDFPRAAQEAVERVILDAADDFEKIPTLDKAVDDTIARAHGSMRLHAPATTTAATGSPQELLGNLFSRQKVGISGAEEAQVKAGQAGLDQPFNMTAEMFEGIDPNFFGGNPVLRSAVDDGLVTTQAVTNEQGVQSIQVMPTDQSRAASSAAAQLQERVNTNRETIQKAAGIIVNAGVVGGADVSDIGAAVMDPEAAPEPETAGPPAPEPAESFIEQMRRRIQGDG